MRPYEVNDNEALSHSKVTHQLFGDYLADFSGFDPSLNETFAAEWESANALAEDQPTDETVLDEQQGLTTILKQEMKQSLKAANDVRYSVGKTFPDDATKIKEFGFQHLQRFRHSAAHLIIWLKVLHNRAEKYATELDAKGFSATDAEAILTRAAELEAAEVKQEAFKRERLDITRQREAAHIAMWKFVSRINEAANIIYDEAPEKLNLFKLPQPQRKSKKKEDKDTA